MTVYELYAVRRDSSRLKSLYAELAEHEGSNPYRGRKIKDIPKGRRGREFTEWYEVERERILEEISRCMGKVQEDRRVVDEFIRAAPYPECDIIRFRVVNGMSWEKIGEELYLDRRTVSRRFYAYLSGHGGRQGRHKQGQGGHG